MQFEYGKDVLAEQTKTTIFQNLRSAFHINVTFAIFRNSGVCACALVYTVGTKQFMSAKSSTGL